MVFCWDDVSKCLCLVEMVGLVLYCYFFDQVFCFVVDLCQKCFVISFKFIMFDIVDCWFFSGFIEYSDCFCKESVGRYLFFIFWDKLCWQFEINLVMNKCDMVCIFWLLYFVDGSFDQENIVFVFILYSVGMFYDVLYICDVLFFMLVGVIVRRIIKSGFVEFSQMICLVMCQCVIFCCVIVFIFGVFIV